MASRAFFVRRNDGRFFAAIKGGVQHIWTINHKQAKVFNSRQEAEEYAADCPEDMQAEVLHKSEIG